MDILEILEELEEKIEKAKNIPIINRALIDKEDLLADVEDIRLNLPEELKQARWLKEERKRILAEANAEAEGIIKKAEEKSLALTNEHEITKKAYEQANEIIEAAQGSARTLKLNTLQYCDEILGEMEGKFEAIVDAMKESRHGIGQQVNEQ